MALQPRAPFLGLAAALVIGCGAGVPSTPRPGAVERSPNAGPGESSGASPGATSGELPALVDISTAGAVPIEATYAVDRAVIAGGRAWVAGMGDGIGVLDGNGRLRRSVEVDGACGAMDVGFGAVWTVSCDLAAVVRVDIDSGAADVAELDLPLGDPEGSVGAGEGAAWVVAGTEADQLVGIDPRTLEVATTYAIPAGGAGVRAGFGAVWVTRPRSDELLRVDAESGQVVSIHVPGGPRSLALGRDAVWVLGQRGGTVSRVDPATNAVAATIALGGPVDTGDIAVGGGGVWVRGGGALVTRIDPATDAVTDRYGPLQDGGGVAAGDSAIWITAKGDAMIWCLPVH